MEGERSSFVHELFPKKDSALSAKSDILTSIFPQTSSNAGMDSSHRESTLTLNRRKSTNDFRSSNGQNITSGGSPVVLCEIAEPCLMSSSIHYGGRDDFIPDSSSNNSVSSYNYKNDKEDDFENSDVAIRGEWWQGSFYY